MIRILVSACLLGEKVRHDGRHKLSDHPVLARWREEGRIVPVCPEVAGGLPTPRPPAEIFDGDGDAVWRGEAKVRNRHDTDVTEPFTKGAEQALALAVDQGARLAVLKAKSPSCGVGLIYDGSFSGNLIPGSGVTASLLESHDIRVFTEQQIEEAAAWLAALEHGNAAD
ncbi:DUF523 domain-containing protein [Sulfidibacter corallicola]|uniref:DUF523 domain-containing protein n=1 Tax=Sulfidibacter corallicola TaxID=2818388 RepID=A0A8A4TKN0_SULCO|nr:DUF523 domain-containing protein [Sulfidibacter corallicola]QTD50133.1 DUF523 domain-containing protein [Sulfidibacter corallicola]